MTYLVAIAIGPVQEFIAAARRCRDLWYGSQLLSEISKAAALELKQRGANLIFPAPENDDDLQERSGFTVVNKLLASVETPDVEVLLREVRRAARARLKRASNLKDMKLRGMTVNEDLYQRQLGGILEFYSAWTPLTDNYHASRKRVEGLLAARKTLRDFPAYRGEAGKYKSSLDGARESVIEKRSNRLYSSNLKENEYLDAIGIVKRFGEGNQRFDSTVDVAAVPFVKSCENGSDKRKAVFRRYKRFVLDQGLLPETYSLLYEHESRQLFDDDEKADRELKDFRAALGKPNPPYYALLLGDGDRMGGAIGELKRPEEHQKFSRELSRFASAAQKMIDNREYGGCSIYCGGDDVLALLPLHTALPCAQAVNELFRDSLKDYDVTFSAGLVVAHGLEPLNEVRNWAAEAEHTAKAAGGRDALCISVNPRSGAPISLYGKWDELTGPAGLLLKMVELYSRDNKAMPRGLGYELRDLVERLKGWPEIDSSLSQLVLAVAKKKECKDDALELIRAHAVNRASVERLYQSMMVARWFARAEREAKGDAAQHTD
jgi:CRISPR-associated protein Cmr2